MNERKKRIYLNNSVMNYNPRNIIYSNHKFIFSFFFIRQFLIINYIQAETVSSPGSAKKTKPDEDVDVEAAAKSNLVCKKRKK